MLGWADSMINESSGVTLGVVITLLTACFVLWRWIAGTIRATESEARAEREKLRAQFAQQINELHDRISKLREAHAQFELDVAKHYASDDRLQQMEAKFTQAIEKLINRFDAFATDFHQFAGRVNERTGGRDFT